MRSLIVSLAILLVTSPSNSQAASRSADLDSWFNRDLAPYVKQQLSTLPRFRNESFRFVVMLDDSPQSEGSALAVGLRDRLRDAVSDVPGIRVAWQADQPGVGLVAGETGLNCTKNEANYFVGIELSESSAGQVKVQVRALDIEERSWVAGFSRSWSGPVTSGQRRQLRTYMADPTFRGERNAPWNDTETDLMAAHLAYELGCSLLRQTAGEYVVAANNYDGNIDATAALVELVSNNLAGARALQFSAAPATANAVIEGKAHRIDDDLFQFWVTITPTDANVELAPLSADAYVRIPDQYKAASLVPEATYDLSKSEAGFLASFSVVRMQDQRSCMSGQSIFASNSNTGRNYGFGAGDCFALQVSSSGDAVVFFLNHQLNYGLVRLGNSSCTNGSMAKIARSGENVQFPLPLDSLQSGSWSGAEQWSLTPGRDTYYALASRETKAARALSRHIDKLPQRCSSSVRNGLEGRALRNWLEELDAITGHWESAIDWQVVHVKDVY